jgi:hypothetical protein
VSDRVTDTELLNAPPFGEIVGDAATGSGTVGVTVNVPVLAAVPYGVPTTMVLVVAPNGTVITICVLVLLTIVAGTLPSKITLDALPRLAPVTVTVVPTGPDVGEKLMITGTL